MKTRMMEIICDNCGKTEYLKSGIDYRTQARQGYWVLSIYGEFCSEQCYKNFKHNFKVFQRQMEGRNKR